MMIRFHASASTAPAFTLLATFCLAVVASCGGGGGNSGGGGNGNGGGGGGGGGGNTIVVSAEKSAVEASLDFGVRADGVASIDLIVTVRDDDGEPLEGYTVELIASGDGNLLTQPDKSTNANGIARGTLATTVAEVKTIRAVVDPGDDEVEIDGSAASEFVLVVPGTFFVRASGNDNADGESPATAWRTVTRALTQLQAGDVLYVGAGTYTESVTIDVQATADEPLVLIADDRGLFTSDGGEVVLDAGGAKFGWRFQGAEHVLLRGFCTTNASPNPSGAGGGVWLDGAGNSNISLVQNQIFDCGVGVYLSGATGVLLEGNLITNQFAGAGDGIAVTAGAEVLISNNLVYNNARYGLRVFGAPSSEVVAELNTFYLNGDDQVRVQGTAGDVLVRNSVLSHGAARGFHFSSAAAATESHNVVFGHSLAAYEDNEGGTLDATTATGDPLFISPAGSDGLLGGAEAADDLFLVDAASPLLDVGVGMASSTLLRFGGPLSGYSSRLDGVLDGSGPDGPELNAGYHYRAEADPFASLEEGDARLFFGRVGEVQAVGRAFTGTSRLWLQETKVDPANATIRWVENRVSPVVGDEELLAVLTDDGVATHLFVRRWDGKEWTEADLFQPALPGIGTGDSQQRGFDLEYESLSGDALVVMADGDNSPRFRTLVDGAWSVDEPVFGFDATPATVLWVELVPSPISDEISLVALDDSQRLIAAVWDGSEWITGDQPVILDTESVETRESQSFDAAYESKSGDLLVTWGYTTMIEEVRYATKRKGSTNFGVAQINSADAVGTVVRLASDPTSNHIVCALGEGSSGDDDVVGLMWDGKAWGDIAELDLTGKPGIDDLAVAWVGESGVAILLYPDADDGDTLSWARWDFAGWKKLPDVMLPVGKPVSFHAERAVNEDALMVLLRNEAGELYSLYFDGDDWTLTNSGLSLGTQLTVSSGSAEPFGLAFRR